MENQPNTLYLEILARMQMLDRLRLLHDAGLPLQTVLVLSRFALAGDAVYTSQCQVLNANDAVELDQVALHGVRTL